MSNWFLLIFQILQVSSQLFQINPYFFQKLQVGPSTFKIYKNSPKSLTRENFSILSKQKKLEMKGIQLNRF
jgi:hypothetical protein